MPVNPIQRALTEVEKALKQREPERAWAALAPFAPSIDADADLALAWLTLLRITPGRDGLRAQVQRILARWPNEPRMVMAACDALVRAAELKAPDEPPQADGPAQLAAQAAQHALEGLSAADKANPDVAGYLHMTRGNALRLAHLHDEALASCQAALACHPNNGDWWFNLGLVHKARHAWSEALQASERARALLGDRKGVLWNIAICATALGRGELAVEALRALGMPATLSPSGMPLVEGLPPVQVRAATIGTGHGTDDAGIDRAVAFELVWVSPLSPCHGVVQSTTFRDASVDYGDLVLWDGTPIGITEHEGRPVPRFALLSVLRKGDERRLRFVALEHEAGDVQAFGAALPSEALLFVHRARIEQLCARCASGDHMRKHEHGAPEPHRLVYGKLVVPADVDLKTFRAALDAVLKQHTKVQLVMPALLEAIGDTHAAGKAHQMWRGLERTAQKSPRPDRDAQARG
ncbi:MAG TPA: tetratricopeptide repeat protein [Polyangiales bacterium]